MLDQELINLVVQEVMKTIDNGAPNNQQPLDNELIDITSKQVRREPLLKAAYDGDALLRMMKKTSARIGIWRAGPRQKTKTLLTLRADHAAAQDAVYTDVDSSLLSALGLMCLQTLCADKDQHLTRPDLGRQFSEETLDLMRKACPGSPQVQIYISDGLSSRAIKANVNDILPTLKKGLEQNGIKLGVPFFVKYGRVPAMDVVTETLKPEITCVLIGERPGLASSESMSAYITYGGYVGMQESRRTVVSNIHAGGISAVEAGAYIVDVIKKMLVMKTSGVELKL